MSDFILRNILPAHGNLIDNFEGPICRVCAQQLQPEIRFRLSEHVSAGHTISFTDFTILLRCLKPNGLKQPLVILLPALLVVLQKSRHL
jgi:hypothetical protein